MDSIEHVADAFFKAFISQDADALERLYDPDLMMTSPSGTRSGAEHARLVREGAMDVTDLHYEEIQRDIFDGGFVQQHLVCCVLPTGTTMRKPACVVVRVANGRIVGFNQYFDPAPLRDEPMYLHLHDATDEAATAEPRGAG
jgi:ketosteroid isomerase-like protein